MPLNIVVFYGSVRSARQGIKAARFTVGQCRGHVVDLIDPLKYPLPLLDKMYAVDIIIKEHWAQSGFANTDLDDLLKEHGIDKIFKDYTDRAAQRETDGIGFDELATRVAAATLS
jgi:hypothetical protein